MAQLTEISLRADNVWTMIPPMNAVRSDACATALNDKVFIVGGFTGDGVLPSVEFYDPQTNVWTVVSGRRSHSSQAGILSRSDQVPI